MTIRRYNPFQILGSLDTNMERLFDPGFFLRDESTSATSTWVPHVDIKEEPTFYMVYADLPGVSKENIQVNIEQNTLTISGERGLEHKEKNENFSRVERFSGNFYRQFTLPDTIDSQGIDATYTNGVLDIKIPKIEKNVGRHIEVKEV